MTQMELVSRTRPSLTAAPYTNISSSFVYWTRGLGDVSSCQPMDNTKSFCLQRRTSMPQASFEEVAMAWNLWGQKQGQKSIFSYNTSAVNPIVPRTITLLSVQAFVVIPFVSRFPNGLQNIELNNQGLHGSKYAPLLQETQTIPVHCGVSWELPTPSWSLPDQLRQIRSRIKLYLRQS